MEFLSGLLCDQIRQEVNGKLFVIGAYTGDMVFPGFPAAIPLAMLAQVRGEPGVERAFHLRFKIGENEMGRVDGSLLDIGTGATWLPLALPPLSFAGAADMTTEYQSDNGTWIEFFRISVVRAQVPGIEGVA